MMPACSVVYTHHEGVPERGKKEREKGERAESAEGQMSAPLWERAPSEPPACIYGGPPPVSVFLCVSIWLCYTHAPWFTYIRDFSGGAMYCNGAFLTLGRGGKISE